MTKKLQNFAPNVLYSLSWSNTDRAKRVAAMMPDGKHRITQWHADAFRHVKDMRRTTPDAVFLDVMELPKAYEGLGLIQTRLKEKRGIELPQDPNVDRQFVAAAIELLEKCKDKADTKEVKPPKVFMFRSADNQEEVAQMIADRTNMDVHVFKEETVKFPANKSDGLPFNRRLQNFEKLMEQTDLIAAREMPHEKASANVKTTYVVNTSPLQQAQASL